MATGQPEQNSRPKPKQVDVVMPLREEVDRLQRTVEKLEMAIDSMSAVVIKLGKNVDEMVPLVGLNGNHQPRSIEDPRFDEFLAQLGVQQECLKNLQNSMDTLCNNNAGRQHPAFLIPQGSFLTRLNIDCADKGEVAKYVTEKWFVERGQRQNVFIQASSMVLPLAWYLEKAAPSGSVIYTTSSVFHLPLLHSESRSRLQIYPFCGSEFDHDCAGWLIPQADQDALDALKALFTRTNGPLKTSFLTPIAIAPGGVLYEKLGAAIIADAASLAEEIVILSTGNRVCASLDEYKNRSSKAYFGALSDLFGNKAEKITVVVSGCDKPLPEIAYVLRQSVGRLWWNTSSGWVDVSTSHP
ncbi:hypothetical protein GC163_12615 [bacterium]|nr:hypothetical protein [bacterium]